MKHIKYSALALAFSFASLPSAAAKYNPHVMGSYDGGPSLEAAIGPYATKRPSYYTALGLAHTAEPEEIEESFQRITHGLRDQSVKRNRFMKRE